MANEVLIFGENFDPKDFSEINKDLAVVSDGVCIVKLKNKHSCDVLIKKINKIENLKAIELEKFKKIKTKKKDNSAPLDKVNPDDLFAWQFSGNEQFGISHDGTYKLYEIVGDSIELKHDEGKIGRYTVSCTGQFLVYFYKTNVNFYISNFEKLFTGFVLDNSITGVKFRFDDKYALISTACETFVVDVFRGKIISNIRDSSLEFVPNADTVFSIESNKMYSIQDGSEVALSSEFHDIKTILFQNEQVLIFSEGKLQKITYINKDYVKTKIQANIESVTFDFSKSRGYARITRKLKNKKFRTIETYSTKSTTITEIQKEIKSMYTSDEMIVVKYSDDVLDMFIKEGLVYKQIKTISKDDGIIVSVNRNMMCLFDPLTKYIEFYDHGELRSTYLHQGCSNIIWSNSGLYVCAISKSNGLLQLFNCNGRLLIKKVFNDLNTFYWRPFIKLSSDLKKYIKEYDIKEYMLDEEVDADQDTEKLLSEWKKFLVSKKELLFNLAGVKN